MFIWTMFTLLFVISVCGGAMVLLIEDIKPTKIATIATAITFGVIAMIWEILL